ncbi:ATP-binding protein [Rhizobium leguminosarum]
MGNFGQSFGKYSRAVVISSPAALLFAFAMVSWPQATAPYLKWLTNSSQGLTDPIVALGTTLGFGGFVTWLAGRLSTDLFPVVAGLFASQFLSALALLPIANHISITDRLWPLSPENLNPIIFDDTADQLLAISRSSRFVGRTKELSALLVFARSDGAVGMRCAVLTGGEGVGKTRLAREWLERLQRNDWDAGFLVNGTTELSLKTTRFRKDTAIVVDDAARLGELWGLVAALPKTRHRVRVLVVDQFIGGPPSSLNHAVARIIDEAVTFRLHLNPLADEELRQINGKIPRLVLALAQGRPLFALLGDNPHAEIRKRASRRLGMAKTDQDRQLLTLGALVGPFPFEKLESYLQTGLRSIERLQFLFEGASKAELACFVPKIEPPQLANAIILQTFGDMPNYDVERLIKSAAQIDSMAVQKRLASMIRWSATGVEDEAVVGRMQAALDTYFPNVSTALKTRLTALSEQVRGLDQDEVALDDLTIVDETNEILKIRPLDDELFRVGVAIYANLSMRLGDLGRHDLVRGHIELISKSRARLAENGDEWNFLIPLGFAFRPLAYCSRWSDAAKMYPLIKPVFVDVLNGTPTVDPAFSQAFTAFPSVGGALVMVATATSNDEMLDDVLEAHRRCVDCLVSCNSDTIAYQLDFIVDSVEVASGYFSRQGRPERIAAWIYRFHILRRRLKRLDPDAAELLNSTIWKLRVEAIIAYSTRGATRVFESRARRLIDQIELTDHGCSDQLALLLRTELSLGAVINYVAKKEFDQAQVWARYAFVEWERIPIDFDNDVRTMCLRMTGCLLSLAVSDGDPNAEKYQEWIEKAEVLWPVDLPEIPPRSHAVEIVKVCIHVQLYKARVRDDAGVEQWMSRLMLCASHSVFLANPEIATYLAAGFYNAILSVSAEYPQDQIRVWRRSLLGLVEKFPDVPEIQTMGSHIPDLWSDGLTIDYFGNPKAAFVG